MLHHQYPAIENDKVFENFIKDLFNSIDKTTLYTDAQLFGVKGQTQKGIDIICYHTNTVIQCKCKDISKNDTDIRKKLFTDIKKDFELAKNLKFTYKRLIFTSTFRDDAQIQEYVIQLQQDNNTTFTIEYWGWQTICSYLEEDVNLKAKYFPQFPQSITKQAMPLSNIDNKILIRADYYKMMEEMIDLERISLGDYLEDKYNTHIHKNPHFVMILYKDVETVLEGVYNENECDLMIENGDLVIEYGGIKLTGNPCNLVYAQNYLWHKITEDIINKNSGIEFIDKIERFENQYLKPNYNTKEYNDKLLLLKNKIIESK